MRGRMNPQLAPGSIVAGSLLCVRIPTWLLPANVWKQPAPCLLAVDSLWESKCCSDGGGHVSVKTKRRTPVGRCGMLVDLGLLLPKDLEDDLNSVGSCPFEY